MEFLGGGDARLAGGLIPSATFHGLGDLRLFLQHIALMRDMDDKKDKDGGLTVMEERPACEG